jgi:hypothetical protein
VQKEKRRTTDAFCGLERVVVVDNSEEMHQVNTNKETIQGREDGVDGDERYRKTR